MNPYKDFNPTPEHKLLFSVDSLASATAIGRTLIYEAVKNGELKTRQLIVAGKNRKRRVIHPDDAKRWVDSFPKTDNLKS